MKQSDLSDFIRRARLRAGFSTIRELWAKISAEKASKNEEWISYPYFQQIESTGRIPKIEDFLEIVHFLQLDEREACFLYAKSIMPTTKTKSFFDLSSQTQEDQVMPRPPKTTRMEPDQVYELSNEQISFFASNPDAYDLALVLADTNARSLEDIATVSNLSRARTKLLLDELLKLDLIVKHNNEYRFVKSSLRISGNQSTKEMQWQLFSRHLKQTHLRYFDATCTAPKYRTSMISPLHLEDAARVLTELRHLSKKVDSLEVDPSDATQTYYLGIVFGPRFNEANKA